MRKKKTAFVLIFAASLVMMAFTVIPHHHHSDRICFERFHNSRGEHNHDPNNCSDPYHCILNQVVESQAENIIAFKNPNLLSANNLLFNILQNALPVEFHSDEPASHSIFILPQTDFFVCSFVGTLPADLRAPPQI
jgi:hypothetical protein